MDIVPYSTLTAVVPFGEPHYTDEVTANGVHISCEPERRELLLATFESWFEDRAEVELVSSGESDKLGLGFVILEWIGSEIDQLFLDILRKDSAIIDYTTYVREEEEDSE
jgi:hypothetical protein